MKKKEAKNLSIEKWEMIVANDGEFSEEIRDTFNHLHQGCIRHYCGYCDKYYYTRTKTLALCGKCPIRPKIRDYDDKWDPGCCQKKSLYLIWEYSSTKQNAQAVLDLIINS